MNEMNGDSELLRLYWTTWANEMNMCMNHASGAGLNTRPVNLHPNTLPLCYSCSLPLLELTYYYTDLGLKEIINISSMNTQILVKQAAR